MPGAIALGLLASLFTHMVLFGNGHSVGGTLHDLLLQGAGATAAGLIFAWVALAWHGRRAADGSILGARLLARLPSWPSVAIAATLWYALIEHAEAPHADPSTALALVALAVAAACVCAAARTLVRSIALAVVTVLTQQFEPRRIAARPTDRRIARPRVPALRRRFARPPPIASCRA